MTKEEPIMSSTKGPSAELVLAAIDRAVVQSVRPVAMCPAAHRRSSGAQPQIRRMADRPSPSADPRGGRSREAGEAQRCGRLGAHILRPQASRSQRSSGRAARVAESPQHRLWSDSRRLADQEIDRIRHELAGALGDGTRLLREAAVPAATWLELAQRLSCAAERLGAVVYCVADWPEPGEDGPDPSRGPRLRRLARFGKQP